MAPLTRRAARQQAATPTETPTSTPVKGETLFEEPIALRSKRKSPSNTAEEDTEAATPQGKRLEVRIREERADAKSPIEVLIPSSAIKTPRPRSSPVPDSQGTSPSDEGNQTFEPLSASKQLEEEATQKLAAESRLSESGQEATPLPKAARSTRASSGKKSDSESTSPSQTQQKDPELDTVETPRPKAAKSTHVVFGDDDDVDKFVAAAAEKEKDIPAANGGVDDKEEQEESDDEAPEAVSTAAAARETLKSARAAIEAAEQYAASTKRKRQARDNLLKQQAQKRKRTKPSTSGKGEDSSEDEGDKEEVEEEQKTISKRQRRTQKLPDMLPAEFLTDSSDNEDDEAALKKMVKGPQKINFETAMQVLSAEGRGPRDEVVGSTRYRVLAEQGDPRLAPKANKNSLRVKEDLLRRGRARVTLNKKRGFFVKR
ncbi:hypothetical protein FHL15_006580 [Xylaria flabelliformis]|uniref:Uncharacterized protein n=1 Tax=Xylaria flabelliformis TaxID=2512241 RepID=A0A553HWT9_9PEZI|nr:hypothetical protein FHL15_006580 [Xylaria flabelliformis]